MKKFNILVPLFMCFLLSSYGIQAQHAVKEKHLIGNWKLIIEMEEAFDEAKKELDNKDEGVLGKIILNSVSGLVTGILDEIEIYMEFMPKGELRVVVDAFGEKEIEYSRWHIDRQGRLFIEDSETYDSDDQDYWLFQDDILVSLEEGESVPERNVYMVKLD